MGYGPGPAWRFSAVGIEMRYVGRRPKMAARQLPTFGLGGRHWLGGQLLDFSLFR
jgi:hypothetical protein